jgi:hypothetical protein
VLDIPPYLRGLPSAEFGEWVVAMPVGNLSELHEHFMEEETQPYTFPFSPGAHHVHTVVPITGTDER